MSEKTKSVDKVAIAIKKIEDSVVDIFSSDNFKNYLKTMSKFHNYSFGNQILIRLQKPDASLVAGFAAWKNAHNRHVNKGEKGIAILAPTIYKKKAEVEKQDEFGNKIINPKTQKPETEIKEVSYTSFRVVNVFDISQTSGEPLPSLNVEKLQGESELSKTVLSSVREMASEFNVVIGYADPDDSTIKRGANGYYSPIENIIVVNGDLSPDQQVKTIIHEIAHSVLHGDPACKISREDKEIQAESTAFVVCEHFGLDSGQYSFNYVAGWAQNKKPEELKKVLQSIHDSAQDIINRLEPIINEKTKQLLETKEQEQSAKAIAENFNVGNVGNSVASIKKKNYYDER